MRKAWGSVDFIGEVECYSVPRVDACDARTTARSRLDLRKCRERPASIPLQPMAGSNVSAGLQAYPGATRRTSSSTGGCIVERDRVSRLFAGALLVASACMPAALLDHSTIGGFHTASGREPPIGNAPQFSHSAPQKALPEADTQKSVRCSVYDRSPATAVSTGMATTTLKGKVTARDMVSGMPGSTSGSAILMAAGAAM